VDAEIIEADFQQYYNLDSRLLISQEFSRFCRLLAHLPFESRFVQKYNDTKDWDWDKEIQSQILHALDIISCQLANMARKEGRAPCKAPPQLQPDYVKKAKREMKKIREQEQRVSEQELNEMRQFWTAYNNQARDVSSGN